MQSVTTLPLMGSEKKRTLKVVFLFLFFSFSSQMRKIFQLSHLNTCKTKENILMVYSQATGCTQQFYKVHTKLDKHIHFPVKPA